MPEESRDTRRGIQNVQQRVSNIPSRETVGERHLRGGKWGPKAANDAEIIQAANDEYAYAAAIAVEEAGEAAEQSRIMDAIRERGRRMLLKKALGKKAVLSRQSIRWSIGIAINAYILQIFFAVGALIGFGLQGLVYGAIGTLHNGGLVGKALEKVAGFISNFLPFEPVGLLFLGLGILLSLVVLIGYLIYFYFLDITILQSSVMVGITVVCFAFNIAPGLNLLPWLLLWVIYMSLFSSSE